MAQLTPTLFTAFPPTSGGPRDAGPSTPDPEALAAPFCPECGRPLIGQWVADPAQPSQPFWWPTLLLTLGLFLAVVYGVRAWGTYRTLAHLEALLRDVPGCVTATGISPDCTAENSTLDSPLATVRPSAIGAHRQGRDRESALAGATVALAGASELVRRRMLRSAIRRSGECVVANSPVVPLTSVPVSLKVWQLVEMLLQVVVGLLVVVAGCFAMGRLALGETLSWGLVDQTVYHTVDLVNAVGSLLSY